MYKKSVKFADRVLAVFLTVIMLFSTIPVSVFANAANETDYMITVKDETANSISEATVDYSISVDGEKMEDGNVVTDKNGVTVIELSKYADQKTAGKSIVIDCNVSKEGFIAGKTVIAAEILNGSTEVILKHAEAEMVNVSISKTGNGVVKINGKDDVTSIEKNSKAEIKVTPQEGAYIEELTVNGVKKDIVDGKEFVEEIVVTEEVSVVAVFSKTYAVTVEGEIENGIVTLNDENIKSVTAEQPNTIKIKIVPNDGYQITKVILNETEQKITNADEFETVVSEATSVKVEFVKVYKVTIKYNSNGVVKTDSDPDNDGGEVAVVSDSTSTFESGKAFMVIAVPNENYRVSKVEKDGKEIEDKNIGVNGATYKSEKIIANEDHTFTVTFAPNEYNVSVNYEKEKADIEISSEKVKHGDNVVITCKLKNSYDISEIFLNGKAVFECENVKYEINDDNSVKITISNVTDDIKVSFAFDKVAFNFSDAVTLSEEGFIKREKENNITKYIYQCNSNVGLSTSKYRMRVTYTENGENKPKSVVINKGKALTFDKTAEIKKIEIRSSFYTGFKELENFEGISIVIKDPIEGKMGVVDGENFNSMPEKFHNNDFTVSFKTKTNFGIAKIEYQTYLLENGKEVYIQGKGTEDADNGLLYEHKGENSTYDKERIESVKIDAQKNSYNYGKVYIRFIVTDNYNEESKFEEALRVNVTAPQVAIEVNGENENNYSALTKDNHYQSAKATITFTDRDDTFDLNEANKAIKVTAKDKDGKDIKDSYRIIKWDGKIVTVEFLKNAFYSIKVDGYMNKAQLSCSSDEKSFLIDTTVPYVTISAADSWWNKVAETITFGVFKNDEINVTLNVEDNLSGVKEIAYYKDNGAKLLTFKELDELYADGTEGEFQTCKVENGKDEYTLCTIGGEDVENERCVVYARITDNAGMYVYVGTNGIIYDKTETSISDFVMPEYPKNSNNESTNIYNSDIEIGINISEIGQQVLNSSGDIEKIYSGLKEIKYELYVDRINKENPGTRTQAGTLFKAEINDGEKTKSYTVYNFDWKKSKLTETKKLETLPSYSDLVTEWNGIVKVNSKLNNSDNVTLVITATDNAGNISTKEKTFAVNTDSTEVKIEIGKVKDDGTIDTSVKPVNTIAERGYYNAPRKAVITIVERFSAFNEEKATDAIKIEAVDAKGNEVPDAYTISEWRTSKENNNIYEVEVEFNKDANYTFSFEGYVNNANNPHYEEVNGKHVEVNKIKYTTSGNTVSEFTVDTTAPTGKVTILEKNIWDKLLEVLTFGLFSNDDVTITYDSDDETSLLNKTKYYKTKDTMALSFSALDNLYQDGKNFVDVTGNITIQPNELFVVYYRIEDIAGNYTYINSDGCIVDEKASEIVITPEEPLHKINDKGVYNGDVKVNIKVSETDADDVNYAGIKSIEYWIENGDTETQRSTLYNFAYADNEAEQNGGKVVITDWASGVKEVTEFNSITQAILKKNWEGSIVVDSKLNNSCDVVLNVKTVDNADNESTVKIPLDIDITAPTIGIKYDNNKDNGGNGHFNVDRTATVTITERAAHFDKIKATAGINITAVNAKNEEVKDAYTISDWVTETVDGETPDQAKHTATIHFAKDANYKFDIAYTDNSENKAVEIDAGDSVSPFEFTVDTVEPFGTLKAKSKEGREVEWDNLITDLTFGFWSREEIAITNTADDETSPIASVEYYIVEANEDNDASVSVTAAELDKVNVWTPFEKVSVNENKRFTLYLKVTDEAGNYSYISTDGLIVDEEAPINEVVSPEVTLMPEVTVNGLYNDDVTVAIKVIDPIVNSSYSGLKNIYYKIYDKAVSETKPTQVGTLFTFDIDNPKQEQLVKEWNGQIKVDSSKNNSNNIVVEVFAEDNSLNMTRDDITVKIDTTDPKINVSYNNNKVESGKFFKANRVATIVIEERNFNPDEVIIDITHTDGSVPKLTKWKKTEGTGNLDNTKWTATITYAQDGDYTFDIKYTDMAGNENNKVDYENSKSAKKFTIDKKEPVISVTYDNNHANSEKYFSAGRTATIVINEHNFDINRVDFIRSSTLSGKNITAPSISWSHSGDIHTATINYSADGDYTFDVKVRDKAGNKNQSVNYRNSVAGKAFTVDKTIEKPKITGIENGKAYKDDIIPVISFSDTNYKSYEIKLLRTRMGEKNIDVTSEFIKGISQNSHGGSGSYDTFEKIADNDGIYTLKVKMMDKAGNEETNSVTFTVNRFGSVYKYGDYLNECIETKYINSIDNDLVITEYNADKLVGGSLNIEVTRDGKPLKDVEYSVSPKINNAVSVGESGWFEYEYTISKENFESDGVYKVFVSSEDATGNKPENGNYEDMAITFMVDSTAPEITSIIGLENPIINATEQEVKYTAFDTIGLKSITVLVDGEPIGDSITDFSVDLNNYNGTFKLSEKSPAQKVQIIVEDLAGNKTDTDSETFASEYAFNNTVTISTNFFVRWFANKPLFFGSIAGFVIVLIAIFVIVSRRRKIGEE